MKKIIIILIALLLIPCIGYVDSKNRDAFKGLLTHSIEISILMKMLCIKKIFIIMVS